MGLRFYKRINLGKGLGLNISKSGIRPSYRSKRGSISSRGFTLRSGIPGLNYRKNFSKSTNKGCIVVFMIVLSFGFVFACTDSSDDSNMECESKTCSDFQTQSEAQSAFDADPDCYDDLDTDNDNIPCENLPE